jgi:DNA-binding GntR family transcriptional regulator
VVSSLKAEILQGDYPIGSQLPTEEELCERFDVSRYTVREALRRLREDRLVESRQGAGTTVIAPKPSDSFVHEITSINDLSTFASGMRFDIQSMTSIQADPTVNARLGGSPDDRWLKVLGVRYADPGPRPTCWTEVYTPLEFASVGRLLRRHQGAIFELIEDMFGEQVAEVQQEIASITMPDQVASALGEKPGAAALEVKRTYRSARGKIVQVAINTHPADRFRHTMVMRRARA